MSQRELLRTLVDDRYRSHDWVGLSRPKFCPPTAPAEVVDGAPPPR
jgi:hypothetical protein